MLQLKRNIHKKKVVQLKNKEEVDLKRQKHNMLSHVLSIPSCNQMRHIKQEKCICVKTRTHNLSFAMPNTRKPTFSTTPCLDVLHTLCNWNEYHLLQVDMILGEKGVEREEQTRKEGGAQILVLLLLLYPQ